MLKFLQFICSFEDKTYPLQFNREILRHPINTATGALSNWREWSPEIARQLDGIYRSKMVEFGYGEEPEWRALIDK